MLGSKHVHNSSKVCSIGLGILLSSTLDASQYPPIMDHAIQIRAGERQGWGVSTNHGLLTVRHVVGDSTRLQWQAGYGIKGMALPGYQYARLDLAIAEVEFPMEVMQAKLAKKVPEIGAVVYYRCYLMPGAVPSIRRGEYLGMDNDGRIHIDGGGGPGSSGSGVYLETGEVIGLIMAGKNPVEFDTIGSVSNTDFINRTSIRSDILAVSLIGGMPKER